MKPRLQTSMFTNRHPNRAPRLSGFTLVEVVVALVIFLIGAISIIRIFPPGLSVIQNSGRRAVAVNYNRTTVTRLTGLQSQASPLPDAIYSADTSGVWQDFNGAVAGPIRRNNSLPRDPSDGAYLQSALANYRRIGGERLTVQEAAFPPLTPPLTPPEFFVLTEHPYEDFATARVFIEDTVNNVRIEEDGDLDFTDARLASDNSAFSAPAPNQNRPPTAYRSSTPSTLPNDITYYVSYQWINGAGGRFNGVVDEPKYLETNTTYDARVLAGKRTASQGRIVAGPVSVRFRKLLLPPTAALIFPADRDSGYLPVAGATLGQTVSVDYTVRDWRLLVDNSGLTQTARSNTTPPFGFTTTTPLAVNLPIQGLSDASPPVVTLLRAPNVDDPIVAKRNQTRLFRAQWNVTGAQPASTGPEAYSLLDVAPKTSQIIYNAEDLSGPFTSPRARTVYRAIDQWGHQTSVAARSYLPFPSGLITGGANQASNLILDPTVTNPAGRPEPWREYIEALPGRPLTDPDLYFHPSEAGKTILVSYEYDAGSGATSDYRTVKDAIVTLDDRIVPAPTTGDYSKFALGSGNICYATLEGEKNTPITPTAILSVKGLSVQVRSAWLNYDRYSQEVASGYRIAK